MKYIVLEGSKFTLYPSKASLQAYVEGKTSNWVFRTSSDYPKQSVTAPTGKAIKAGSSVILSLTMANGYGSNIVVPRYQAAQSGKWVLA